MVNQLLRAQITEKATSLGFERTGFAAVKDVPELGKYGEWLDLGYAGEMHYLHKQREKRQQPNLVVPEVRSAIVCSMQYHADAPLSTDLAGEDEGWIARYAWGDDYHDLIKKMVRALYDLSLIHI